METQLTYQVGRDGLITILDGETSYQVFTERFTDTLPWPETQRPSRWANLKAMVAVQEIGIWYVYSGFPSVVELNKAASALSKVPRTQRSQNRDELKLAVKVKPKE